MNSDLIETLEPQRNKLRANQQKEVHQRFFGVPLEDNDESTSRPHQSRQLIRNNHFATGRSHQNRDSHANLRRNNNFFANSVVSNAEPQLNINQEHFNNEFGGNFDGQETHTSTINQQHVQSFSTGEDLTAFGVEENQDPTSALTRQIQENSENHRELLNSLSRSKPSTARPINTFFSVEEPTLTVIDESDSTPRQISSTGSHQRISQQPRSQFPQQLHTQTTFLQPLTHQIQQPQIHDQQIQHQIDSHLNLQQQFQHNSQQSQPHLPSRISPLTHRPRNQRPHSGNNQPRVNLNPQLSPQPEFLINVQADAIPTSVHRFASQKNIGSNLRPQDGFNNIQRQKANRDYEEEVFRKQAENAKYSFASQIDDSINGNQHQREEVRDGKNVKGMYSYSDGYVKRTVFYEADDKGYRVVKEEEEPLGDGPQFNPRGQANVSSFVAGNAVQYSITSDDIPERNPAIRDTII
ncbi:hypothetical protein ILUMI_24231 [Ignelater luminosus]|uniref:Uncharacterized protein n=1 Tax=Ignelater luminosus TaxID=2038154 RepID=A0A8K0C7F1_IGNLU|nr:hypothetical protein ILUMI_24231 [Ignelater luminosus]